MVKELRKPITVRNAERNYNKQKCAVWPILEQTATNKEDSLNRILDNLYEKIEDAQTRLDEVNQEIAMVEKSAMTKQSIFEMNLILDEFIKGTKYYHSEFDYMTKEEVKEYLKYEKND